MSVAFVFEDNENTPSSRLLKESFGGENIYFSDGASKLYTFGKSLLPYYDTVISFLDVSPDNKGTVNLYKGIRGSINDDTLDDRFFVLPIPCIEYYILMLVNKYEYGSKLDVKVSNYVFDIKGLYENVSGASFERRCKNVVNGLMSRCFRNTIKEGNLVIGKFYMTDCNCGIYCKGECTCGMLVKSDRFYCCLPVFDITDNTQYARCMQIGVCLTATTIRDVKSNLQSLYSRVQLCTGLPKLVVK